ncbi:MAG: TetR/AcrR family transcriptional regulator [Rikenellaceae bacterium]
MKNEKKESNTQSTKEIILNRSLEMINEGGMMDFRIDVLALSLKLSPGNITYHFAKKEDISAALWRNFIAEFNRSMSCVSNILDIKQTFLVLREFCTIVYKIRGVVMFSGSDSRVIRDEKYNEDKFYDITADLLKNISEILYRNGYLYHTTKERESLAFQTLIMRWWINKAMLKNCYKDVAIEDLINQNASLILFSLYNQMNDKAKEEYNYIIRKVRNRDI